MTVQATAPVLENPRVAYQAILHRIFTNILARQDFPLQARLFSVAGFAFEADAFVYPESPEFSEERLTHEVDKVVEQVHESFWMEEFHGQGLNLELGMSIIQSLLLSRVQHCGPELKNMITSAWGQYAESEADDGSRNFLKVEVSAGESHVRCADMAHNYLERRNKLFSEFARQIEEEITEFCIRFVEKHNPADNVSLLGYAQQLILRVMLLKFFLASDPALTAAIENNAGVETVMRRTAEIATQLEVHLDQEEDSLKILEASLAEQNMQDIAHCALLILF